MRRILLLAVLLAAVTTAPQPAAAAITSGCCACLDECVAQTSAPPPPRQSPARLCALVTDFGASDFGQRCDALAGSVSCVIPTPGVPCSETLAEAGIVCPAPPGAPAATTWGLAGLTVALIALGALALRRRA